MREKLIDLLDDFGCDISFCDICNRPNDDCEGCKNEQLADYLLANGVIVLPCKVGATLYGIKKFKSTGRKTVYSFTAPDMAWIIEHKSAFGKNIFLTREAAEKTLGEHNNAAD